MQTSSWYVDTLQNKCWIQKGVSNLHIVESVDTIKLAEKLNKESQKMRKEKLKIFVQINTSGEEST